MSNSTASNGERDEDVVLLTQMVIPGAEPGHGLSDAQVASVIEAMLFVAPEPPTVTELAAGAELEEQEIERGLALLMSDRHRGVIVQRHGDAKRYQHGRCDHRARQPVVQQQRRLCGFLGKLQVQRRGNRQRFEQAPRHQEPACRAVVAPPGKERHDQRRHG